MRTIRKADEMRARGVAVVEEIVGRYPDLAGLAEIVKPAKMVMDQTPVPTAPSQSTVPKEVPTVVDSGTPKIYPSSSINTLGIRIFVCPVCQNTFRNHGTADAHIRKEHTKNEIWPVHQVWLHLLEWGQLSCSFQEAQVKFFEFFYTIFCTFPFCNIFYLMISSWLWVSCSMVQLFRFKICKKIVCVIILYVVKVWQIQV